MNETVTKVISLCLPNGLEKSFPMNQLIAMTASGAKGSNVNFSQMTC